MKVFIVLLSILTLSACSGLKITDMEVTAKGSEQSTLLLVTNKDLSKYENTSCVLKPNLNYGVSSQKVSRTLGTDANEIDKPFDAFGPTYVSCPSDVSGYCSEWKIKNTWSLGINNIQYSYKISQVDTLSAEVSGGNILSVLFYYFGCGLSSNTYEHKL